MQGFKAILAFAGWVLVCFAAASLGAFFQPGEWYAELQKPAWTPPSWLFGPVWSTLYLLMGVAAWLVWKQGGFGAQAVPLSFFCAQLACNAAWSWLCFGLHNLLLALLDLTLLWMLLLLTIVTFWKVRMAAALLLLPYILWVSFAGALNFTLWRLNG